MVVTKWNRGKVTERGRIQFANVLCMSQLKWPKLSIGRILYDSLHDETLDANRVTEDLVNTENAEERVGALLFDISDTHLSRVLREAIRANTDSHEYEMLWADAIKKQNERVLSKIPKKNITAEDIKHIKWLRKRLAEESKREDDGSE